MGKYKHSKGSGSGKSIVSHVLHSTVGLVKTYRTTYSDGSTFDTIVNDGTNGTSGGNNGNINVTTNIILTNAYKGKRLLCYDNRYINIPAGLDTDFWCIVVNKGTGTIIVTHDHIVSLDGVGDRNNEIDTEFAIVHEGANWFSMAGKLTTI